MTISYRKLWPGLVILAAFALVTSAAVVGGIEGVLAALGAIVLIGIAGAGIYVIVKVLWLSGKSPRGGCLEYGRTSAASFYGDGFKYAVRNGLVEAAPISEEDKRLIMKHIDELFAEDLKQSREKPAEATPISEQDKKLIMEQIDTLFQPTNL